MSHQEIIDQTVRELGSADLSGSARVIARLVLRSLRSGRDQSHVISRVLRVRREVRTIADALDTCAGRLEAAEQAQADLDPYGPVWWAVRRRAVTSSFDAGEQGAAALWLRTWFDVLRRNAFDRCLELTDLEVVPDVLRDTADRLRVLTDSLRRRDHLGALDPLAELTQDAPDAEVRAGLGLLQVRILLLEYSDRARVRAVADAVQRRAHGTDGESWGLTAAAEERMANGTSDEALDLLRAAVADDTSVVAADAHLLLGELAERANAWADADAHYDHAVVLDDSVTVPALLRRAPARLLVRAASDPALAPDAAVDLLQRAVQAGVPGDGAYPDRDVWAALADRLLDRAATESGDAATESRTQAAAAYHRAGQRYAWLDFRPRALELLRAARDQAPEVAEYRWDLGELLRVMAWRPDGIIDRDRLLQARAEFEAGLDLRTPGPDEAWPYLSLAKVLEDLDVDDVDPALLHERALLLDPGYALTYPFLADTLRKQGWLSEAEDVMAQGEGRVDPQEALTFSTRVGLCMDRGDLDRAFELIDQRIGSSSDPVEVRTYRQLRAGLHLQRGRPAQALHDVLDDQSDLGRTARAMAYGIAADIDPEAFARSRNEYESLWQDTRNTDDAEIAGWAAYGAGRWDEAIEIYRAAVRGALAHNHYSRDLGQMLIARGDVAEGAAWLAEGIAACPYPAQLRNLTAVEFPLIRTAVKDRPDAGPITAALEELAGVIDARISELLSGRRPPGTPAADAALARTALADGDALTALHRYLELADSGAVPEAGLGAERAAEQVRAAGDEAFRDGRLDEARRHWEALAAAVAGRAGTEEIGRALLVRGRLTDLVAGAGPGVHAVDPEAWLTGFDPGDLATNRELQAAITALVSGPDTLWPVHDGLQRVRSAGTTAPETREALGWVLAQLPIDQVYGLRAGQARDYPRFLAVRHLEFAVGSDVADRLDDATLDAAIVAFKEALSAQVGVRIPWIYHEVRRSLEPRTVDFKVYGRWVATVALDGEPATWLDQIIAGLDRTVRGHLFRLVSIDDAGLWLEGWQLTGPAPSTAWQPSDPAVARLRLTRLLRLLLREGASVSDRGEILAELDAAGAASDGREVTTLDTLRAVRLRLGRAALGAPAGVALTRLPTDLEQRLAAGLRQNNTGWETGRGPAVALVRELHEWLDRERPDVVVVADPGLRPFVWRLLADRRPVVLSTEEVTS